MKTHTSGPWIVDQYNEDRATAYVTTVERGVDVPEKGYAIAAVSAIGIDDPNARLIAAAPELLDALEFAIRILDRDGIRPLCGNAFTQTDIEHLQAAVAKARP